MKIYAIIMAKEVFMNEEDRNQVVCTTIYLTRRMYDSLKLMAVLTRSSMTRIVREALKDKLEELKGKKNA